MSGYDTERVNKISQIMPQFGKVAEKGDTVMMGLEGDSLFPYANKNSRPSATITDVKHRANDTLVSLSLSDGSIKEVSSMSLAPDQVWEFDDKSFKHVLDRQKKAMEARSESAVPKSYRGISEDLSKTIEELRSDIEALKSQSYRGVSGEAQEMRSEINSLKQQLSIEHKNTSNFHNTVIASLKEMASDICKVDPGGKHTQFCSELKNQYDRLVVSRAEDSVNDYRGIETNVEMEDFSADDTDFF